MRASTCLLVALAVIAVLGSTSPASHAQQPTGSTPDAQQQRMKSCNTEASSRKLAGDARKTFMSDCVSGKATAGSGASTGNSRQDRMLFCNFQASDRHLTSQARKTFVSNCLQQQ